MRHYLMFKKLKHIQHRLFWERFMTPLDHELTIGTTGYGKSRWVGYKMAKSFEYDRPFCFIDPKGETYWNMVWWLGHTPEGRFYYEKYKHRILFLNPVTGGNNILSFNAIEPAIQMDGYRVDTVAMVANSMVSHIRKQSGMDVGESVRMQNIMNASIATLLQGGKGEYTMAEVPQLFTPHYSFKDGKRVLDIYNPFVEHLLPSVTHYSTRLFWTHQWATWTPDDRRNWTQSTSGRVFQQIFDENVLMTTCDTSGRLDFSKIVRDGVWLFVHIPSAILHDSATILGNIIITKVFNACMRRHEGYDYRLIIDEASHFNSGPLGEILATARSHRLWLSLIVQSIEQMDRSVNGAINERIKEEVRNNVRFITSFNNVEDRQYLARLMFRIKGNTEYPSRAEDDMRYVPIPAEIDRYEKRFTDLKKRQMILYDRFSRTEPIVKKTPDFNLDGFSLSHAQLFEQLHLAVTGTPRYEVRAEIDSRLHSISRLAPPTQRSTPPIATDSGTSTPNSVSDRHPNSPNSVKGPSIYGDTL